MNRKWNIALFLVAMACIFTGCGLRTVNEMYCLPKRSESYSQLQAAIDVAMEGMEYAAPISGENQQTVQMADLTGDGVDEYILFAKDNSEKPLDILIFTREGEEITLLASIESRGTAFEQVEYVSIDDKPGLEIVVGRQVSDQVLRALSVYTFASGTPEQLMAANYQKFLPCDLDENGKAELMLMKPGQFDTEQGTAVLYSFDSGEMTRSWETELSRPADAVKRIMVSRLRSGEPAVYVASAVDESAIITDIFTMKHGNFTNIALASDSGTSVQTMRNYYVYAVDIDGDGVLELPDLINMYPMSESRSVTQEHLIRWYDVDLYGNEADSQYTFHNFVGGWYIQLDDSWAQRVTVIQKQGVYKFYIWDADFITTELVFSIYTHTGNERETQAVQDGGFVLYRTDSVVYAARLEDNAAEYGIGQENLIPYFNLIHMDWKSGET